MDILEKLREYLQSELGVSAAEELTPERALLADGIIDSLDIMRLVAFMENEFGIRVEDLELVPSNFRSLSDIARYVAQKRLENGTPREA